MRGLLIAEKVGGGNEILVSAANGGAGDFSRKGLDTAPSNL
jgi:hypothetical protein